MLCVSGTSGCITLNLHLEWMKLWFTSDPLWFYSDPPQTTYQHTTSMFVCKHRHLLSKQKQKKHPQITGNSPRQTYKKYKHSPLRHTQMQTKQKLHSSAPIGKNTHKLLIILGSPYGSHLEFTWTCLNLSFREICTYCTYIYFKKNIFNWSYIYNTTH